MTSSGAIHSSYMSTLIAQLNEEILQLKADKSCKKDINRVISNIVKEYSHQYEYQVANKGFRFRISGGNYTTGHEYFYVNSSNKVAFLRDHDVGPMVSPLVVESLTFNGMDYDGDIDEVINLMVINRFLLYIKCNNNWKDHTFDSGTPVSMSSHLANVREFCKVVRADNIAERITEGLTNRQLVGQVSERINDNISYYLGILETTKPESDFTWNNNKETKNLHDVVLSIGLDFDTSYIDERIEELEKKIEAAMILL